MKRDATPPPAHDDSLRRLLETELAIEQRLAAAKREAAQLVDAARARAAEADAAADASIARELAELEAAREQALRDELTRIAEDARRGAAAFDAIDETRVRELAAWVTAQVVAR